MPEWPTPGEKAPFECTNCREPTVATYQPEGFLQCGNCGHTVMMPPLRDEPGEQ
jgi:hypothetical protein